MASPPAPKQPWCSQLTPSHLLAPEQGKAQPSCCFRPGTCAGQHCMLITARGSIGTGAQGAKRKGTFTELSWHKAPLQTKFLLRSSQLQEALSIASRRADKPLLNEAWPSSARSPHPRGRAASAARSNQRCSPSGSCGCRICRKKPCLQHHDSCST